MYLVIAMLFAINIIAICLYSIPAIGHFDLKNGLWVLLAVMSVAWLWSDAIKRPRGQLMYSQGQWAWRDADRDIQGTLRLHLDLQIYMLVSFAPSASAQRLKTEFFPIKTQWFHLEARHVDPAARQPSWQGLRRAVHAQVEPSHEELAA
jgi:hypothetical protein